MGIFAAFIGSVIDKIPRRKKNKKDKYIFYRIVDRVDGDTLVIQCVNTKAVFYNDVADVALDADILHGLHPSQACFVGIEYAKLLKAPRSKNSKPVSKHGNWGLKNRYGCCTLVRQTRQGCIGFTRRFSNDETLMDARDIALCPDLIEEFDALQAFYIGIAAGVKLHNPVADVQVQPHLRLVK